MTDDEIRALAERLQLPPPQVCANWPQLAVDARSACTALLAMATERDEAIGKAERQWEGWVKEEVRRKEAESRLATATEALREIGRQKLHAEITDSDPDELDWLGGYEACVTTARAALAQIDAGTVEHPDSARLKEAGIVFGGTNGQ